MSRHLSNIDIMLTADELLPWIPQLLARLGGPLDAFALKCLQSVVNEYPQLIAHHLYYYKDDPPIQTLIRNNIEHLKEYFEFFDELVGSFYDPELILEDEINILEANLDSFTAKQKFIDIVDNMLTNKNPIYKAFLHRIQKMLHDFIKGVIGGQNDEFLRTEIKKLRQNASIGSLTYTLKWSMYSQECSVIICKVEPIVALKFPLTPKGSIKFRILGVSLKGTSSGTLK